MSVDCDEGSVCDVWRITTHTARKEHVCSACDEKIRPGDRYTVHFSVYEREVQDNVKRCARCQAIYEHLSGLMDRCGGEMPHASLKCGHTYIDRWGVEAPLEVEALAFALPGEIR